jgi:hypothetical protein
VKRIGNFIALMLMAVALVTSLPASAQSNNASCGGTTCVQPDISFLPLNNSNTAQEALLYRAQNGAKLVFGTKSEDLTLSTGGTTTDSSANLLPANSFILNITGTVTTTITAGCTGWQLGDPTTAGRFTASNTTLTAGTSSVGSVHATTGIASATTGLFQSAAAKVRVTCATAAPGAGKVRLTVTYLQWIPPAQ